MKPVPTLALLLAIVFGSLPAAEPRPNILYFYVDDLGWGSIGPNGQAARRARGLPHVLTPNLDRLAAEGVNFSRGYGCHVCSPARSSQQSGFHQGHTFADRNDPNNAKKAMRADEVLMGDALSAAGYVTGYWGKWGYGGSRDKVNPVIENIQTLPTSHGYRHVLAELHHVRAHTFFQPTLWSAPARPGAKGGLELIPNSLASYAGKRNYPERPALQNHPDYPETAYCDDLYAFAALDFVRAGAKNYRATGQPFFGLLAVQIPHAPFDEIATLPDWDHAYTDKPWFSKLTPQSRQWAAMVTRIDAHFGNILAALEDPDGDGDRSDSVAADTLVVFQSDNGGPGGRSHVEFAANGVLRGTKGQIQEGGIRVPLVMRWPARIDATSTLRAGTTTDRVVDVSDLLPTFCELAGISPPTGLDGVSIAPTLRGSGHQRKRAFLIHEAGNGQSIIRGTRKLVRGKRNSLSLYDLAADPAEQHDLAASRPALVKELEALLLGERVDEPKGFCNTYHHWTGRDGAPTSHADNWSDYTYANDGLTYLTDQGPPRLSWTATMANQANSPATARIDADLAVLSLEIRGKSAAAPQTLKVGPGNTLAGRNEIRLAAHSVLELDGGTAHSLRWIDVKPHATLVGSGTIDATLYNAGSVESAGLDVQGAYHQCEGANLTAAGKTPALAVKGAATLAGTLSLATAPAERAAILTAKSINGTFANANDEVIAADGTRYTIVYSPTTVTLAAK